MRQTRVRCFRGKTRTLITAKFKGKLFPRFPAFSPDNFRPRSRSRELENSLPRASHVRRVDFIRVFATRRARRSAALDQLVSRVRRETRSSHDDDGRATVDDDDELAISRICLPSRQRIRGLVDSDRSESTILLEALRARATCVTHGRSTCYYG